MVRRKLTTIETTAFKMFKEAHGGNKAGLGLRSKNQNFRKLVNLVGMTQRTSLRANFNEFFLNKIMDNPEHRMATLQLAELSTKGMNEKQINKRAINEFNSRFNVFKEIIELNEIGLKINPKIAFEKNHLRLFNESIKKYFNSAFGIQNLRILPSARLLREIFRYYSKINKWEAENNLQKGAFQEMVKAYVEEGKIGLKRLKFSKSPKDEPIFGLMKDADKFTSMGKTKKIDYYKDLFAAL
jgi:hypothetical protein